MAIWSTSEAGIFIPISEVRKLNLGRCRGQPGCIASQGERRGPTPEFWSWPHPAAGARGKWAQGQGSGLLGTSLGVWMAFLTQRSFTALKKAFPSRDTRQPHFRLRYIPFFSPSSPVHGPPMLQGHTSPPRTAQGLPCPAPGGSAGILQPSSPCTQ